MQFLQHFLLLDPQGPIALAERGLMVQSLLFMLIVAVPVFLLLFYFARQYRASNTKARYQPDWEHSKMEELIWWAIPFEIVLILGAITWSSTHELHPARPLAAGQEPLVIEVVALQWKWLFIYPQEGIASLNYAAFPAGTPVRFDITADAPMNSFWIPQLGGQVYAMTGMVNQLHLQADEPGVYAGRSANYSGDGFAHMTFEAVAMPQETFDAWVRAVRAAPDTLTMATYEHLTTPDVSAGIMYYGAVERGLFDSILAQFNDLAGKNPPH